MKTRKCLAAALGLGLLCAGPVSASELFAVEFSGGTPLFVVDQTDGSLTPVAGDTLEDIGDLTSDTRPGSFRLWGIELPGNQLITIDPTTGLESSSVNLLSPTGGLLEDNMVSLAFDVTTGTLFGNTSVAFGADDDELYEIDPITGTATPIGLIGFDNVFALGFDQSGNLFGVSDDGAGLFISIDTGTGAGALIDDLSDTVGSAFDLASRPEDDVMFLVDGGTDSLYTIDTANGDLTLIGSYAPTSTNLVGLAFSPAVAEPETAALLALALPLAIAGRRRRPNRRG